jgi:hypothetical protein
MRHLESQIQRDCIQWFRLQYPRLRLNIFAVGNGGYRTPIEAAIMRGEGVTAGVADVLLMHPTSQYHALCIEFKTQKGRQSEPQKSWQSAVEQSGYKYIVVRSLKEFIEQIRAYFAEK